jgi:hypothetical protein
MVRAIMDRLPPAVGPHAPPPAPLRLCDVLVYFYTPCTMFFIFYISILWTVQILSLGVFLSFCVHILFLNYAFYVSYGLFSLVHLI